MIDWQMLWLCLFPMVFWAFKCRCCFSCAGCTDGTARQQWQLEVSGIVDDGCTDCDEEANGVFILEYSSVLTSSLGACTWISPQFSGGLCGGPSGLDPELSQTDIWLLTAKATTLPSGGSFSHTLGLNTRDALRAATLQTPDYGLTTPTSCAYDPDDPDFDFNFNQTINSPCDFSGATVSVSQI